MSTETVKPSGLEKLKKAELISIILRKDDVESKLKSEVENLAFQNKELFSENEILASNNQALFSKSNTDRLKLSEVKSNCAKFENEVRELREENKILETKKIIYKISSIIFAIAFIVMCFLV